MHRVIDLGVPPRAPSPSASGGARGRRIIGSAGLAGASLVGFTMPCMAADGNTAMLLSAVGMPLVAVLAGGVGVLWARQRQTDTTQDARSQAELLRQLLDAWHWQTDARHRITRWQPPVPATASDWSEASGRQMLLWEHFDAADTPGLRARLDTHAPLLDLPARRRGPDGSQRWTVRGLPRFDALGRFVGYEGTARRGDTAPSDGIDLAALDALWRSLPGAAFLAATDAADGSLRVTRCNEAGVRLSGIAPGIRWQALLDGLPDPVREVVTTLEPGGQVTVGDWQVHLEQLASDSVTQRGRLLLLLPANGVLAVPAEPSDHESFSYTVSHDLRAPLRVVDGFTRILKEDYSRALDRIGNDHLDRVLGAAARMNSMIDALLALAQLSSQPLARQPVNLSQLAGFVVDDLRRQQPDRAATVRIQPGVMAIGDPTLLRVVLENLLGNAWKYTGRSPQAEIGFNTESHDGRTVFVVHDNGAGFDMRFAERLFGVFQRLHSANDFQGTGVGLASVKRIVLRHGGDVWAEAEVGRGARFMFTLRP